MINFIKSAFYNTILVTESGENPTIRVTTFTTQEVRTNEDGKLVIPPEKIIETIWLDGRVDVEVVVNSLTVKALQSRHDSDLEAMRNKQVLDLEECDE